jgi:hypothetical protein
MPAPGDRGTPGYQDRPGARLVRARTWRTLGAAIRHGRYAHAAVGHPHPHRIERTPCRFSPFETKHRYNRRETRVSRTFHPKHRDTETRTDLL